MKRNLKTLWKKSNEAYEFEWKNIKQKYKVGCLVRSKVLCFYPQGIISNFGIFFNAISDYKLCAEKFGEENMYHNSELELEIYEFDDENKIIKLRNLKENGT